MQIGPWASFDFRGKIDESGIQGTVFLFQTPRVELHLFLLTLPTKKSGIVQLHRLYQAPYYFAHAATFRSFFKSQATIERAVFRRSL